MASHGGTERMGRIADTTVAVRRTYHGTPGHLRVAESFGAGPVPLVDVADRERREALARARQQRPFTRETIPPRWARRPAVVAAAAAKRHTARKAGAASALHA